MWSGPDGYLRPDQFLDHLTVIKTVNPTHLKKQMLIKVHQSQGLGDVWRAGSKAAQPDIPSLAGFLAPCLQDMALVF